MIRISINRLQNITIQFIKDVTLPSRRTNTQLIMSQHHLTRYSTSQQNDRSTLFDTTPSSSYYTGWLILHPTTKETKSTHFSTKDQDQYTRSPSFWPWWSPREDRCPEGVPPSVANTQWGEYFSSALQLVFLRFSYTLCQSISFKKRKPSSGKTYTCGKKFIRSKAYVRGTVAIQRLLRRYLLQTLQYI